MTIRLPMQVYKLHRASGCRDHLHSSLFVETAAASEGFSPSNPPLTTDQYQSDQDQISNILHKLLFLYISALISATS